MPAADSVRQRPGNALLWALLATTALFPLLWGGNRPAAFALCGVILASLSLIDALGRQAQGPVSASEKIWLLFLLGIAAQLLPLPMQWLNWLSPAAAAVHAQVSIGGWQCLSIAPGKTFVALLHVLAYGQAYRLAGRAMQSAANIKYCLWVLTLAAGGQALWGAAMVFSGAEWLVFEPKHTGLGVATGSFVNRNHYAGYLEIGLAAGTALMLLGSRRAPVPQWRAVLRDAVAWVLSDKLLVRALLVVMVIGLVMSRSRMGNVAFAISLAVGSAAWLFWRERSPGLWLFFASVVLFDILLISQYFGLQQVVERLRDTELAGNTRALILTELWPAIQRYLIFGAGLGSFQDAFAAVQPASMLERYEHAHNDYAELLIESGVVGGLLVTIFVGLHLRRAVAFLRTSEDATAAALGLAALMAMTALAVHSASDFNLEIPGVALTLFVLLGALNGYQPKIRRRKKSAGFPSAHNASQ